MKTKLDATDIAWLMIAGGVGFLFMGIFTLYVVGPMLTALTS